MEYLYEFVIYLTGKLRINNLPSNDAKRERLNGNGI